jgi:hypothetical protein
MDARFDQLQSDNGIVSGYPSRAKKPTENALLLFSILLARGWNPKEAAEHNGDNLDVLHF